MVSLKKKLAPKRGLVNAVSAHTRINNGNVQQLLERCRPRFTIIHLVSERKGIAEGNHRASTGWSCAGVTPEA